MPSLSHSRFTGLDQASRDVNVDLHWYALRTNAHHEKRVRDRLTGVGIEPFLPLTRQQRQWSDRKVLTELPLFTGYCFARFSLRNRLTIMQISGVAGIVGSVGPEAIPDTELDAIRTLCESDRVVKRVDAFLEGMQVEIVSGPLRGLKGQFIHHAGHDYIVVRVQLIQQAVAVHIHRDEVVPRCANGALLL
jgi:transcription antitermination factor NusG